MKSESKIQSEAYRWFNNNFCLKHHNPQYLMFSVPNEAIQKMAWKQINKFKATGLKSGVSDTIVLMPNKVLFVEFKTPTGKQSKSQGSFQKRVEGLSFTYAIVRSVDEFKKLVTENL